MDRRIDTGLILRETFALMRANGMATLAALGLLVVSSTAVDMLPTYSGGLNFAIGVAVIFAQFGVTRAALQAAGLPIAGKGRGGSFLLALILTGLGIIIGFVCLILPGIYLWARWSLVSPIIVGEGLHSGEAISESWARTQALVAPISAVMLIFSVPMLFFYATLYFYPEGPTPFGLALLSNLLVYGSQALVWHAAVAIHGLIAEPSNDLEEIFA